MNTTQLHTNPSPTRRSINPHWLEELTLFAEQTYGRARLQEAWAEFNRWRTPPRDIAVTHGRFFNTWLLWDWTPDAQDATLATDIAKECTPAESLLRTKGSIVSEGFLEFLTRSCQARLSFFRHTADGRLEDLLTGQYTSPETPSSRPGIRFGLVVRDSNRDQAQMLWSSFAPENFPAQTAEQIVELRNRATSDADPAFTPELHRAYGIEFFDLYLRLRQETSAR
jgi:hypothetical protein